MNTIETKFALGDKVYVIAQVVIEGVTKWICLAPAEIDEVRVKLTYACRRMGGESRRVYRVERYFAGEWSEREVSDMFTEEADANMECIRRNSFIADTPSGRG
jgi:hypothetical protein